MAAHLWSVQSATAEPERAAVPSAPLPSAEAYGMAVFCWMLSAGVYIAVKWVQAEMPPWTLCFRRVAVAGLVLLPLVRHHYTRMLELVRTTGLELLVIGGLGLAITQGLMYTGLHYTTAINAASSWR